MSGVSKIDRQYINFGSDMSTLTMDSNSELDTSTVDAIEYDIPTDSDSDESYHSDDSIGQKTTVESKSDSDLDRSGSGLSNLHQIRYLIGTRHVIGTLTTYVGIGVAVGILSYVTYNYFN